MKDKIKIVEIAGMSSQYVKFLLIVCFAFRASVEAVIDVNNAYIAASETQNRGVIPYNAYIAATETQNPGVISDNAYILASETQSASVIPDNAYILASETQSPGFIPYSTSLFKLLAAGSAVAFCAIKLNELSLCRAYQRLTAENNQLQLEFQQLSAQIGQATSLATCQSQIVSANTDLANCQNNLAQCQADVLTLQGFTEIGPEMTRCSAVTIALSACADAGCERKCIPVGFKDLYTIIP